MAKRIAAVAVLVSFLLAAPGGAAAEMSDQDWKSVQNAWTAAFQGDDARLMSDAVTRLAAADDSRALPMLAHTVKIANAKLSAASKKESEARKAIDKIPFTQKGDQRTYTSENMEKLKAFQVALKELQEAITILLNVKRTAVGGFTRKSDKKALDWLFKQGLGNPDWEVRVGVVEAVLEIKDDDRAESSLTEALSDKAPQVRVAALSAVSARGMKAAKPKILALLKDKEWEVVTSAIEAISGFEFKDVETIDALIEGLCRSEGRIAEDYDKALERITGLSYYGDGKLWQKWWKDNREKYGPAPGAKQGEGQDGGPAPAPMPRPEPGKPHVTASFFGIETKSHNIIYVLDVSGSMAGPAARKGKEPGKKGPVVTGEGHKGKAGEEPDDGGPTGDTKLDFVKYELKKSIRMLPAKAWFNIIFYSDQFEVWQEEMVKATPQNKDKAYAYIDKQAPSGTTNIFDALERAFKMAGPGQPKEQQDERYAQAMGGADTFFLLSDGSPNAGRVPDANNILIEVETLNKLRKITINTVGVGDHNVPFMQKLAERNGGKYAKAD